MRIRTAAVTVALLLAPLTAACSSSEPNTAACKTAMAKQLDDAVKAGDKAETGTRPAACEGVDAKTLERITGELLEDQVGKAVEDGLSSALPSASDALDITDDCRAWIESELQDDSSSLDASSGEDACGYMTQDELGKAIDQVTEDLMSQG
ncbi:hypothetical protein OG539_32770 [Actinacidiphila glaucinigra]|uniref:hypothetical protein n=1 Tax=Actinacidiphila glaucinigra TaxID=235986 RepID=UPI00324C3B1A